MRILALDVGKARTGVAITDPTQTIAQPLTVVDSSDVARLVDSVRTLVVQHQAERVIVGIPISLSGRRGPMAYWIEGVRRQLASALPVPVDPWDERFSSASADDVLRETGVSEKEARGRQDAVAAAFILQGYLEHTRLQKARAARP